jgi:hypothetical protein
MIRQSGERPDLSNLMTEQSVAGAVPKAPVMHLYLDETGPYHPDRDPIRAAHGCDWFAIGGVVIREGDIAQAHDQHAALLAKWPQISAPLHIVDIRAEKKRFAWLGRLSDQDRSQFWSDFKSMLAAVPVAGAACVIDRPGYRARGYGQRHGDQKWLLCRTSFDIVVERAAKFATLKGCRLRVFFERSNPDADQRLMDYFKNLKTVGLGFDKGNSAKYQPLEADDFKKALISIEGKNKSNRMTQLADSYVYAMARGAYDRKFDLYRRLMESGKLVTSQVPGHLAATHGIKHSCFELVLRSRQTKKVRNES